VYNIQTMVGELLHFNVMHHSLILYGACTNSTCENKKNIKTKEDKIDKVQES